MSSLFEEYTPLTDMDNPFRPSPLPTTVFGTRPASPCGIADDNFLASIEKEFAFDNNFFGLPSFDDFAGIDDDDFLGDNWDLPDLVSRSNDDERPVQAATERRPRSANLFPYQYGRVHTSNWYNKFLADGAVRERTDILSRRADSQFRTRTL